MTSGFGRRLRRLEAADANRRTDRFFFVCVEASANEEQVEAAFAARYPGQTRTPGDRLMRVCFVGVLDDAPRSPPGVVLNFSV